jgi:hypothetical protein
MALKSNGYGVRMVLPWGLQLCERCVTVVLQWYHIGVTVVLPSHSSGPGVVFPPC